MEIFKCINCGQKMKMRPGRFAVCECGHTELCDILNGEYISEVFDDYVDIFSSKNGKRHLITVNEILKGIVGLPVNNAMEIKVRLTHGLKKDIQDFIMFLPAWAGIAHHFQTANSKGYRMLTHNAWFDIMEEVMVSGELFPNDVDNDNLKILREIYPSINPGSIKIAIDAILFGMDNQKVIQIANAGVDVESITNLLTTTNFSLNDIVRYINDFAEAGYAGTEIAYKIAVYHDTIKELEKLLITQDQFNDRDKPADISLFFAENIKRICKLTKEKTKQEIEREYDRIDISLTNYTLNGISIKTAPLKAAIGCRYFFPENDRPKEPPLIIYRGQEKIGILYIGMNGLYLSGESSDEIKQVINCWLDSRETESKIIKFRRV